MSRLVPKAPFVIPPEMARLLALPGMIKGTNSQTLLKLYQDTADNFCPFRDLSKFGTYCFLGNYDEALKEWNRTKPDLKGTETVYKWGYISLASFASQGRYFNLVNPQESSGSIPILKFLIKNAAPIDLADIAGLTALHHVAMNNRVGEVLRLLLEVGTNPNKQDRYGATPLHSAIMANQLEAAETLLGRGANLEIPDSNGYSPLRAVRFASLDMQAIIHKYNRRKNGVPAPMEDKSKCTACGKDGSKHQCARCRIARYCGPQCQVIHWKEGHKKACVPFRGGDSTTVCKPTFGMEEDCYLQTSYMQKFTQSARGEDTGEGRRPQAQKAKHSKSNRNTPQETNFLAFNPSMLGKSMIVKMQVPLYSNISGGSTTPESVDGQILVYNKNRDFVCRVIQSDDLESYAKLEAAVRKHGSLGGLKGYFVAELESRDALRIKTAQILADQPW